MPARTQHPASQHPTSNWWWAAVATAISELRLKIYYLSASCHSGILWAVAADEAGVWPAARGIPFPAANRNGIDIGGTAEWRNCYRRLLTGYYLPVTSYHLPLTTYQQFVVTGYCHRQHFQLGFLRMCQRDVLGNNSPFQLKLQMSIHLGFCFSRGYALKRF